MALGKQRRRLPLQLVLVLLLGLVVRANILPGTYLYDDLPIIQENVALQRCDLATLFSSPYWRESGRGLFRPVTLASFCLADSIDAPTRPVVYHAQNLLLHLLNCGLLWWLLTLLSRSRWITPLGAVLFAVHPILTEPVNLLVGRAELLVGFFALMSLLGVALYRLGEFKRRGLHLLLPSCLFLALLCKENAVLLPLLWILLPLTPILLQPKVRQGLAAVRWRELTRRHAPLLIGLVVVMVCIVSWRYAVLGGQGPLKGPIKMTVWYQHIIVPLQVLGLAASKLIFPWPLKWDYDRFSMPMASSLLQPYPLLGLTLLLATLLPLLRRRRTAALLLLWFVAAFTINLQVIPIGVIFAERFLYLPLLAVLVGAALLIKSSKKSPSSLLVGCATTLLLLMFAVTTMWANRLWQDDWSFWSYVQAQSPAAINPNYNMAMLKWRRGDLDGAEWHLRENLRRVPHSAYGRARLEELLLQRRSLK